MSCPYLPVEIIYEIFSHLTDSTTIQRLIHCPNPLLREITRSSIRCIDNPLEHHEMSLLKRLITIKSPIAPRALKLYADYPALLNATFILSSMSIELFLHFVDAFIQQYCLGSPQRSNSNSTGIPNAALEHASLTKNQRKNIRKKKSRQRYNELGNRPDGPRTLEHVNFTFITSYPYNNLPIHYIIRNGYPLLDLPMYESITVDQFIRLIDDFRKYSPLKCFDCRWFRVFTPWLWDRMINFLRTIPELEEICHVVMICHTDLRDYRLVEQDNIKIIRGPLRIYLKNWTAGPNKTLRVIDIQINLFDCSTADVKFFLRKYPALEEISVCLDSHYDYEPIGRKIGKYEPAYEIFRENLQVLIDCTQLKKIYVWHWGSGSFGKSMGLPEKVIFKY